VNKYLIFLLCILGLISCSQQPDPDYQLAESYQGKSITLYVAKNIITLDDTKPNVTAVAVHQDRIVGIGLPAELRARFSEARVKQDITFKDKVIVPGFISQHIHPSLAAMTMGMEIISIEDWVLPDRVVPAADSRESYLARLLEAERGMASPDDYLATWGYHHYFHGTLNRQDLDGISQSRPILVWHRSAHEFILNTAALNALEINQDLLDTFTEEQRSHLSLEDGHFREQGLFAIMPTLMKAIVTPSRLLSGLRFVEHYLHTNGITLISEPGGLDSTAVLLAQLAILGDSDTPFRSYFIPDGKSLMLDHSGQSLIEATEDAASWGFGRAQFLPKQVKLFSDGAIFSQAMQMLDPYLDGHSGAWITEPARFREAFQSYWEAGYQIHVHQNGDRGLEMLLDVLEENMKRHPRSDHRTVIVHFGFANREQVKRISRLGALVSANPYYPVALADRYGEIGLGPERANEMVRLGDVEKEGISFSLHSDMPMAPAKPLFLMWSAVNRLTGSGRVAGPQQRISAESALRAVTLEAAYSLRLEGLVGSIEPGKLANFTILTENPLRISPESIKDIAVWGTVQEGRVFLVQK